MYTATCVKIVARLGYHARRAARTRLQCRTAATVRKDNGHTSTTAGRVGLESRHPSARGRGLTTVSDFRHKHPIHNFGPLLKPQLRAVVALRMPIRAATAPHSCARAGGGEGRGRGTEGEGARERLRGRRYGPLEASMCDRGGGWVRGCGMVSMCDIIWKDVRGWRERDSDRSEGSWGWGSEL